MASRIICFPNTQKSGCYALRFNDIRLAVQEGFLNGPWLPGPRCCTFARACSLHGALGMEQGERSLYRERFTGRVNRTSRLVRSKDCTPRYSSSSRICLLRKGRATCRCRAGAREVQLLRKHNDISIESKLNTWIHGISHARLTDRCGRAPRGRKKGLTLDSAPGCSF